MTNLSTSKPIDPSMRYADNPYFAGMVIPVKGKAINVGGIDVVASTLGKDNEVSLINKATGEDLGTAVSVFRKVDEQQFIKLFTHNIKFMFSLTAAGCKALGVILWKLQNNIKKDELLLDMYIVEEFNKYHELEAFSVETFRRGLSELTKAQILAKTKRKGFYWINPDFAFNGDRISFVNTIVMEKGRDHAPKEVGRAPQAGSYLTADKQKQLDYEEGDTGEDLFE